MVQSHDQLETQLLGLPPRDRARLAEVLLASLEDAGAADSLEEAEEAWRIESERRFAEMRNGTRYASPTLNAYRWISALLETRVDFNRARCDSISVLNQSKPLSRDSATARRSPTTTFDAFVTVESICSNVQARLQAV